MRRYGLICQGLMLAAGAMLATTTARTTAFAAEGPFHIEHTWQIDGEGGWDYIAVDPQGGLLYVTRGNHVQVVDRKSGKQVADITGLHGTHGVVFAPGETDTSATAAATRWRYSIARHTKWCARFPPGPIPMGFCMNLSRVQCGRLTDAAIMQL